MTLPSSSRLAFDPFTEADAPFVLRLLNEPGFLRFIGDRGVRTDEDARRYLRDGPLRMYAQYGYGLLRLTLRGPGGPVGMCGLLKREGLDRPDLGFAMLREFERQGLATEAAQAVLEHAAAVLGIPSVLAIVDPDNAASLRVLARLGFAGAGVARLPGIPHPVRLLSRG